MTIDTKALRRAAEEVVDRVSAVSVSPRDLLVLLDRLERAERREPASREAGEIVEAVLGAFSYDASEEAPYRVGVASRIVQRALELAEERGAEAADEQRDIERRHGPEARR